VLRPTLFSHRKLEVPLDRLAISAVPGRTLRSPTAGIGTELIAHGENIEVTLHGSKCARSPVPISRAHRHHTRVFAALPRRMPQTSDCLAERDEFELAGDLDKRSVRFEPLSVDTQVRTRLAPVRPRHQGARVALTQQLKRAMIDNLGYGPRARRPRRPRRRGRAKLATVAARHSRDPFCFREENASNWCLRQRAAGSLVGCRRARGPATSANARISSNTSDSPA
jgi:hypothetical protein